MPGLKAAHEAQDGAGQRAVIHRGSDDHIVEIVFVNDLHAVIHHTLCGLPAAAAVHAGGDVGIEGGNLHYFTLQMLLQFPDQGDGVAVRPGRTIDN